MGKESPGKGVGARWKGRIIRNSIYTYEPKGSRDIPILWLPEAAPTYIPTIVLGQTRYEIERYELSDTGYEALYAHVTGQTLWPKPERGTLKKLLSKAGGAMQQEIPPTISTAVQGTSYLSSASFEFRGHRTYLRLRLVSSQFRDITTYPRTLPAKMAVSGKAPYSAASLTPSVRSRIAAAGCESRRRGGPESGSDRREERALGRTSPVSAIRRPRSNSASCGNVMAPRCLFSNSGIHAAFLGGDARNDIADSSVAQSVGSQRWSRFCHFSSPWPTGEKSGRRDATDEREEPARDEVTDLEEVVHVIAEKHNASRRRDGLDLDTPRVFPETLPGDNNFVGRDRADVGVEAVQQSGRHQRWRGRRVLRPWFVTHDQVAPAEEGEAQPERLVPAPDRSHGRDQEEGEGQCEEGT